MIREGSHVWLHIYDFQIVPYNIRKHVKVCWRHNHPTIFKNDNLIR